MIWCIFNWDYTQRMKVLLRVEKNIRAEISKVISSNNFWTRNQQRSTALLLCSAVRISLCRAKIASQNSTVSSSIIFHHIIVIFCHISNMEEILLSLSGAFFQLLLVNYSGKKNTVFNLKIFHHQIISNLS